MNFNLMPPLQYFAAARVASRLIPHPEIDAMIDIAENMPVFEKIFDSDRYDYWKQIEIKANELLGNNLPPLIRMMVTRFIRPMSNEIYDWVKDHIFFHHVNLKVLKSCVSWQTDGTINKMESAKKLVRNEQIDLRSRFVISCSYFLCYETSVILNHIIDSNIDIPLEGSNSAVRFWANSFRKGTADNWYAFVDSYFGGNDVKYFDSRMRLSCFFDFLSLNNKIFYFNQHTGHKLHLDDFIQCVNKMEEPYRTRILATYATTALNYCLRWPFQNLFKEMARRFAIYMNLSQFGVLFGYIIDKCILKGLDDYNYKELLEDLWDLTPADFKEEFNHHQQIMKQITIVHLHEGDARSLGITLNKYMNRDYP